MKIASICCHLPWHCIAAKFVNGISVVPRLEKVKFLTITGIGKSYVLIFVKFSFWDMFPQFFLCQWIKNTHLPMLSAQPTSSGSPPWAKIGWADFGKIEPSLWDFQIDSELIFLWNWVILNILWQTFDFISDPPWIPWPVIHEQRPRNGIPLNKITKSPCSENMSRDQQISQFRNLRWLANV